MPVLSKSLLRRRMQPRWQKKLFMDRSSRPLTSYSAGTSLLERGRFLTNRMHDSLTGWNLLSTGWNLLSTELWKSIGLPSLQKSDGNYQSASKHTLPIVGAFTYEAKHVESAALIKMPFLVSEVPDLNLLGRDAIKALHISLDKFVCTSRLRPRESWPNFVSCIWPSEARPASVVDLCKTLRRIYRAFQTRFRIPPWFRVGN